MFICRNRIGGRRCTARRSSDHDRADHATVAKTHGYGGGGRRSQRQPVGTDATTFSVVGQRSTGEEEPATAAKASSRLQQAGSIHADGHEWLRIRTEATRAAGDHLHDGCRGRRVCRGWLRYGRFRTKGRGRRDRFCAHRTRRV